MRRVFIFFILILLLPAVMLAACQSQGQAAGGNTEQTGNTPAFAANMPDVYGEVKSISGTEVTLALIEMPQQRFNRGQGYSQPGGGNQAGGYNPNGNTQNGGYNQNGNSGRTRPSGSFGQGSGTGGGRGFGNMPRNYTGETVTLNIPSGTPISTYERGSGSMNEKQLAFSDIKVGSLLQVWYKKDSGNGKEVDKVRVMQIPSANGNANNAGSTGNTAGTGAPGTTTSTQVHQGRANEGIRGRFMQFKISAVTVPV